MFAKLAKVRHVQRQRMALPLRVTVNSNDNLPGFRRPRGSHRIPSPVLACHWDLIDGALRCHWRAETPEGAAADDPDRPDDRARPESFAA